MIEFKRYLPITLPVLYVGLKNDWLTTKEVAAIVNNKFAKLNLDDETVTDINVNDDDKSVMLEILRTYVETEEHTGIKAWELARLIAIEQSQLPVHEKLREVEQQWARFGYPESWRDFIYYLPNGKIGSEEAVYQNFLNFINQQKGNL